MHIKIFLPTLMMSLFCFYSYALSDDFGERFHNAPPSAFGDVDQKNPWDIEPAAGDENLGQQDLESQNDAPNPSEGLSSEADLTKSEPEAGL